MLSKQWPSSHQHQLRLIDENSSMRSIFEHEYEYEGFKFFLAENYSIPPTLFKNKLLSIREINNILKHEPYKEGCAQNSSATFIEENVAWKKTTSRNLLMKRR